MKTYTKEQVLEMIQDLKWAIMDNCYPSSGDYDYGVRYGEQDAIFRRCG